MDVEGLYERLLPRLTRLAGGMSNKRFFRHRLLADEFAGLIGLEFMKAVNSFRKGRMSLEDWVTLNLQNAIRDARKYHDRRPAVQLTANVIARDGQPSDIWLDLSEDAVTVAQWLIAYRGRAGKGVDSIKAEAYRLMNWRRFHDAVEEIKTYLLGAEPC